MELNAENLADLRVGFDTSFQGGIDQVNSQFEQVSTTITSSQMSQKYGWLKDIPGVREWVGDLHVNNLEEAGYEIVNKKWEDTIGVSELHVQTDNLGTYGKRFEMLGRKTAQHTDQLVFNLLKAGFITDCFDNQFFFDTDHPVIDENGAETSYSNHGGGAGTPWYLLATNTGINPIIFQTLNPWQLTSKDSPDDDNVFWKGQLVYASKSVSNVGFGFPQTAFGSKQTLDLANYEAAYTAMMSFKGDHGAPLGIVPNLLVVPPTLAGAARKIVKNALAAGGETNEWAGSAEVLVSPWLV